MDATVTLSIPQALIPVEPQKLPEKDPTFIKMREKFIRKHGL